SRCGPALDETLHSPHTPLTGGGDPRCVPCRTGAGRPRRNVMPSRRTILGTVAVVAVGLVTGAVAGAQGGGMHSARHGMMKRRATAMIDEALEPAQVTPEQRAKIYAARDRAFTAIEAQQQTRSTHMAEALALFEADTVDPGQLAAFRAQREAEHRLIAD